MEPDPDYLLAIDAGNTRIKWGVHDGRKWSVFGAAATGEASRISERWARVPKAARAIASNVAGAKVQAHLERACAEYGATLTVIRAQSTQLGVINGYLDYRQLGADRWAALIAAHQAHRGHKLVVNAGTALTIDALLADGHFLGGLIVPGPDLMRRSLNSGTAALKLTDGRFEAFPARTPDAITSGAIQASIGAIERTRQAMAAGDCPPALLILSGGAAAELAAHLPMEFIVNENLVLDGLALIARNP